MSVTTSIERVNVAELMRDAMRGLASSVSVLSTTDKDGNRYAMTATSVTSLCMDPPAMLFCVFRNSAFHVAMQDKKDFCINVLASDNLSVAQLCSSKVSGEERFANGHWIQDEFGVPYLSDAQAAIICEQDQVISYGTHDIFIGRVRDVRLPREISPLIYVDRTYRTLTNAL